MLVFIRNNIGLPVFYTDFWFWVLSFYALFFISSSFILAHNGILTRLKLPHSPMVVCTFFIKVITGLLFFTTLLVYIIHQHPVSVFVFIILTISASIAGFLISRTRKLNTKSIKVQQVLLKILSRLLFSLISLISFVVILEACIRLLVIINTFPFVPHMTNTEITLPQFQKGFSKNMLFDDVNTFSRVFFPQDKAYWLHEDYTSPNWNITNHIRVTTDQPQDYQHTIYMLGGSTLFSVDSPDYLTIPSQLQAILNQEFPNTYQVVNLGTVSYSSMEMVNRLEDVTLLPGDLVIFYAGINDTPIFTSFTLQKWVDFTRFIKEPSLQQLNQMKFIKATQSAAKALTPHWMLFRYLYYFQWEQYFSIILPDKIDTVKTMPLQDYQKNIVVGYEITQKYQGLFFNYLQPNLFSLANPTDREQKLQAAYGKDYTVKDSTELLKQQLIEFNQRGIHSVDLTAVLDAPNREPGEEFYFDYCHVNYRANAIIARAIFEDLIQYLP